ncbi:methylmalonyl Co-A mutase-associated GTPase MeaB [Flavisolibacter ginsengisoli]|jgi:LAO/AO transport system kinase|uniref:LAO/AO transport system kinase n=1 Tax=Flavisolibacter ginsengisoli DSM 18119 TaxID=1121884 RepID=A0A1M5FLU4_9BACT|nr:methylmalonyl Co-A mutase-associated GTPase MeaB [Flavisolibacter ginsengisoli]SHF92465.1 LAO/AO transport system kinase [Flavisolibacter ginsengisoli DSM 18119]
MWQQWLAELKQGDIKALARSISLVENGGAGYEQLLEALPYNDKASVIGITGPPGAGKSTLVDALIGHLVGNGKKVAVLCVDPSSPFNLGAVLGDRIRMSNWYTHPNVYIRSLATRGSMGGLNPRIIEITELVKAAGYDYVIVETVGVGQSEIEVAGLADTTVVVMVPEGGDEIQTMKAGLMEIADIFVVNKSDRPDADAFVKNLRLMLAPAFHTHKHEIPIIKTVASSGEGIAALYDAIKGNAEHEKVNEKKIWLLTEKAWHLIQQKRMQDISKYDLYKEIETGTKPFNLYRFVESKA